MKDRKQIFGHDKTNIGLFVRYVKETHSSTYSTDWTMTAHLMMLAVQLLRRCLHGGQVTIIQCELNIDRYREYEEVQSLSLKKCFIVREKSG